MLLDLLKAYSDTAIAFHMPGHKRNTALASYLNELAAKCDITEIHGFDDLHAPSGILLSAMEATAEYWGSDRARFLVNGSTSGILSAIYALGAGGGSGIIARNVHKSAYHALELTGVKPVFLLPEYDPTYGCFLSLSPASVQKALDETPDTKFVMLVSPSFEGVISDVKAICAIAHAKGVPVIVDEAHGAHLSLSPFFPGGAVQAGADIVIQSVHKMLPSLTQTAIAHVSGSLVDFDAFCHALDIFETSSPSYLLMASIDGCVHLMRKEGQNLLRSLSRALDRFYEGAKALTNLSIYAPEGCFLRDKAKILISSKNPRVSGLQFMNALRSDFSIELEAAYPRYAVAMAGAGTTEEALNALLSALKQMDGYIFSEGEPFRPILPRVPACAFTQKQALLMPFEEVPMKEAAGRISAEYRWAYPPGIPVVAPGERIDEYVLDAWRQIESARLNAIATKGKNGNFAVLKQ